MFCARRPSRSGYNSAYGRAKEWINSFPPESLFSISVDYASAQYPNDGSESGTFLLDFAIHLIDLVGFLFGDASKVFAFSKGPDAYSVSIQFANGAVGSMNLNDGRSFDIPTEEVEISIKGGNFMTIHNSSVWRITENGKASEWREPPTFVSGGDSGHIRGTWPKSQISSWPSSKAATPRGPKSTKATRPCSSTTQLGIGRDGAGGGD